MTDVETEIEPPGLDLDEDDGDRDGVSVHVGLFEVDGTRRAAYALVPGDATDDDLAAALVDCLFGAAACRGPSLAEAVARQLAAR